MKSPGPMPFPPEYDGKLWEGVEIECNKACNSRLVPRRLLLDLKHEIYAFIRTHWQFDPSRASVETYIANFTRWRINEWRERTNIEWRHIRYYGDEEGNYRGIAKEEGQGGIDEAIEAVGFTDLEKKIVEWKLERRKCAEIARLAGLKVGQLKRALHTIREKLHDFHRRQARVDGGETADSQN